MDPHRRSFVCAALVIAATAWPGCIAAQTPAPGNSDTRGSDPPQPMETIDLWPKAAPGMPLPAPIEVTIERSTDPSTSDRILRGITRPRLVVFKPERPNGAAVLLMPGGGYRHVVVDKEGYDMARWLTARGFTAFVLFYRLPGDGWQTGADVALADAQRAIRSVRHRASHYTLDPERVACMGFSAGGHLCASLSTRFASRVYDPVDAADALSARPFGAALIYPVVSMRAGLAHVGSRSLLIGTNANAALENAHSPDQQVPIDAPPHFLLHAEDDTAVAIENTLQMRAALRANGISVESHLFRHGGHGFGLRKSIGKPVGIWPNLWIAWAAAIGLI